MSHKVRRSSGAIFGPALRPSGLASPAEFDVGAVRLARALAHPEQVRARVVPQAGGQIDPGHRLLEAEQQRLVRGVSVVRLISGC